MPNLVQWGDLGTITTSLDTGLNSLADSANALGTEIDNATDQNMYADFQLTAAYSVAPSAGGYVSLYFIQALDGTNYADGDGSTDPPASAMVGNWPLRAATGTQVHTLRHVLQPATKYKPLVINEAGQAMVASGNTVKFRAYNEEIQ